MRAATGFHHYVRGRLLGKELLHLRAAEIAPRHRTVGLIDPVQGENLLGRVYGDALVRHGGRLPVWTVTTTKPWHSMPWGRPPQQTPF